MAADPEDPALAPLGWGAELAQAFADVAGPSDVPGRVSRVDRGGWVTAETAQGPLRARKHPRFRRLMDPLEAPTVGDWASFRPDTGGGPTRLQEVLPRRSAFVRTAGDDGDTRVQVVAANVDVAMVLVPLDGDRNVRRLDRLLSLAWTSGATPVLVLTKADAVDDPAAAAVELIEAAKNVAVHVVSAVTGAGLDAVSGHLHEGRTIVLVGTSGAGKSTLANRLYGQDVLETGDLRGDGGGRHTTTHRELLRLPGGGLLIDTPGLRSIGVWAGDSAAEDDRGFADVEEVIASCRFTDCAHSGEPGCAVAAALASGELAEDRWDSYRTLTEERRVRDLRRTSAQKAAETRRSRAARAKGRGNRGR